MKDLLIPGTESEIDFQMTKETGQQHGLSRLHFIIFIVVDFI